MADEMGKVPNTPQFASGNAILDELQQFNTRFDTMTQQINTRFDTMTQQITELGTVVHQINTRLEIMDTTIQVRDHNNAARISNSLLLLATDVLAPLRNPRTNTSIAEFPTTSAEIGNMTSAGLNAVLRELGLGTEGQKLAREQRLRQYIGLRRSPA